MEERIKVLIADDIYIIAKNIRNIVLRNDSVEVLEIVNNGKEEYEKILELKPDLVFTDNKMPEINGIDVIEKINNLEIEDKPEFVLITGDRDTELIRKANNLGILKIINKPVEEEKVLETIEEYKRRKNEKESLLTKEIMPEKIQTKENIWKRIINFLKNK